MLEVHYFDVPPKIEEKTAFSGRFVAGCSDPELLMKQKPQSNFATLEFGGWPLDGTRILLGQQDKVPLWSSGISSVDSGYLGAGVLEKMELGSETTELEEPTELRITLTEPCSIPGITFVFSKREDLWCSRLQLRWYLQEELLWVQWVQPDKVQYSVDCPVERFDAVEITFLETSRPGCYVKMQELYLGHMLVFGQGELKSVALLTEVDPALGELSVDTMTLEIHDPQKRRLTPRKNQKVELFREGALVASYFVESCTRQDLHQYTFQCGSAVGQLEDTFLGGMYENVPVEQVLAEILGEYPFVIGRQIQGKTITGYLPICTRRQALQQVAFAVGARIKTLSSRQIELVSLMTSATGSIEKSAVFFGAAMETADNVSRIEVVAHSYTALDERETLVDETLEGEPILLTFQQPHHSYEVTGGTLLQQGVNFVVLQGQGQVKLTAGTYNHIEVRHERNLETASGHSQGQIRAVEEATLVNQDNVQYLLDRLTGVFEMHHTLQQSIVVDGHHAGEFVSTEDPWGDMLHGYITQMQSELTAAGQTAKVTVMGKKVRG